MKSLILLMGVLWPQEPINQCNLLYSRCVESLLIEQSRFQGCKGWTLLNKVSVVDRLVFSDVVECERHLSACEYNLMGWQVLTTLECPRNDLRK